jgi:hypothetical protein
MDDDSDFSPKLKDPQEIEDLPTRVSTPIKRADLGIEELEETDDLQKLSRQVTDNSSQTRGGVRNSLRFKGKNPKALEENFQESSSVDWFEYLEHEKDLRAPLIKRKWDAYVEKHGIKEAPIDKEKATGASDEKREHEKDSNNGLSVVWDDLKVTGVGGLKVFCLVSTYLRSLTRPFTDTYSNISKCSD